VLGRRARDCTEDARGRGEWSGLFLDLVRDRRMATCTDEDACRHERQREPGCATHLASGKHRAQSMAFGVFARKAFLCLEGQIRRVKTSSALSADGVEAGGSDSHGSMRVT